MCSWRLHHPCVWPDADQFGALHNPPGDWPRLAAVTLAAGSASADEKQHAAGSVLRPDWPDSVRTTARLPVLPA